MPGRIYNKLYNTFYNIHYVTRKKLAVACPLIILTLLAIAYAFASNLHAAQPRVWPFALVLSLMALAFWAYISYYKSKEDDRLFRDYFKLWLPASQFAEIEFVLYWSSTVHDKIARQRNIVNDLVRVEPEALDQIYYARYKLKDMVRLAERSGFTEQN